jgi:hypothetical protein
MTKLAAIEGQLVSIKNVSTHKSACLTIHVPEEYALKVIEAFGWPTMVAPVPVAIAKLDLSVAKAATDAPASKPKKSWDELSLAQQAGILCDDPRFAKFLEENYTGSWERLKRDAAAFVREYCCDIQSRAELDTNKDAGQYFIALEKLYRAWLLVGE